MKKFILLLLLIGCTSEVEFTEFSQPMKVFFCPIDNCEETLVNQINSALHEINCAFYDLDSEIIINTLENKDIDIKLVIDNNNKINSSLNIVYDNDNQLMHNKFCIIDNNKVITGSFNPTQNNKNLNNLIILSSNYLANNYKKEFNELYNKQFGEGEITKYSKIKYNTIEIENLFCPEDNCRNKIIHEILNAKKSVNFMLFSFTDEEIADALLFSSAKISGIVDKTQAFQKYSQYQRLKEFNINIKYDNNPYFLHHKVFIIDEETLITGSYNPTLAGNFKNDENILIIRNKQIAKKYIKEFNSIT